MNELLKKYESIDQSKLNEGAIKILNRVKTLTSEFSTDDAKNNKIAEDVLNEIMKKYPDSVKIVKRTPKAKPAPKKVAKAKKPATVSTAKKSGNNIMSVAKEIQKAGESWKEAMERAKQVLKDRREQVVQKQKTELEKLYALVKTKKELQGFTKSDIQRDAVRTAKPTGARVVTKQGFTSNQHGVDFPNKLGRKYWETRDRHADRLAPNYPKDTPLLADGGEVEGSKIWDLLSKEQKGNFITKYKPEIEKNLKLTRDIIFNSTKNDNWNVLDKNIKNVFNKHIDNKKFYFENIGKKVTWEDYQGDKRKGEIDGIDFNGNYIVVGDNDYDNDVLSPDEVTIKDSSKKKYWLFDDGGSVKKVPAYAKKRLEELRQEIREERISYAELAELQSLAKYIDPNDVELLEPAGVPEFEEEDDDNYAKGGGIDVKKNDYYNKYYEKASLDYIGGEIAHTERSARAFRRDGDDLRAEERDNHAKKLWQIYYSKKNGNKKMANGGSLPFMTDPNFGNFQNTGAFADGGSVKKVPAYVKRRLEELREEIIKERISTGEIAELESLKQYIDPSDFLLLQWAGVPEFEEEEEEYTDFSQYDTIAYNLTEEDAVKLANEQSEKDPNSQIVLAFTGKGFNVYVKKSSFSDGGNIIADTVSAIFNPNEKDGKIKTTFGDKTKTGFFEMMTSVNNTPEEITSAIFIPNEKTGRVYTEFGAKTKKGLYEMINNMRNTFELGGAFMMTDLAGHTGGSDGVGIPKPLSGVSGTYYTGLVGETGAMSSGELFMDGGAMAQNQQVINDASQSYVNYYLGEGASQGIYKDGGSIPNNYEGRTPQDIWNNLSKQQRSHFLYDHVSEIEEYKNIETLSTSEIRKAFNSEWLSLDEDIKNRFSNHVREGQYAYGGKTKGRQSMKELYIGQIASLTGTRTEGVEKLINDNNLTDSELSNLMTGIGRGMISRSDFVTALVGEKGNAKQKEVIAFAKSDKAYKMADGGGIRSKEELKKIFSEKEAIVKNLTPKQIAEMWNKNSFGVKEGISKPITIEEAKRPSMKIYLENLLIENELTEDEQAKYFAKGGEIEIKTIKVGDFLQKKDNKAKAKVINIKGDSKYSTEIFIEDLYGNKVSRPLDFTRIDEWKIINEPAREINRIKKVLSEQYADGGFMNNVYAKHKGGEKADIQKMKKALIAKAKSKGIYENFGQNEVRDLQDKYGYTNSVREFDNWAMNFDLSQMADGGLLNESQIENLDKGFTIPQLNDMLNEMFPYSFGFEVYKQEQSSSRNEGKFSYDYDNKVIKDDKLKLYFYFEGYGRDLNYQVSQGQENTYFKFLLVDDKINTYVGGFGFKDKGDVDESYITKFISFLQDAYHYPFQVRHSVMADGGFMNNVYADRGSYLEDNDGFMKADNEFNYRYPTKDVYIETLDEPIDLTDNSIVKIKEVSVETINDDIDLNEDGRVKVRMGYEPENKNPEKFGEINPRAFEFMNLPMPTSKEHKND